MVDPRDGRRVHTSSTCLGFAHLDRGMARRRARRRALWRVARRRILWRVIHVCKSARRVEDRVRGDRASARRVAHRPDRLSGPYRAPRALRSVRGAAAPVPRRCFAAHSTSPPAAAPGRSSSISISSRRPAAILSWHDRPSRPMRDLQQVTERVPPLRDDRHMACRAALRSGRARISDRARVRGIGVVDVDVEKRREAIALAHRRDHHARIADHELDGCAAMQLAGRAEHVAKNATWRAGTASRTNETCAAVTSRQLNAATSTRVTTGASASAIASPSRAKPSGAMRSQSAA